MLWECWFLVLLCLGLVMDPVDLDQWIVLTLTLTYHHGPDWYCLDLILIFRLTSQLDLRLASSPQMCLESTLNLSVISGLVLLLLLRLCGRAWPGGWGPCSADHVIPPCSCPWESIHVHAAPWVSLSWAKHCGVCSAFMQGFSPVNPHRWLALLLALISPQC